MFKINNTEFNMYSYYQTDTGIVVSLQNTTFSVIATAAGNSARVEVEDFYTGNNLHIASMTAAQDKIKVEFINPELIDRIANVESGLVSANADININTEDIEANAEAIVELAEIIAGGDE